MPAGAAFGAGAELPEPAPAAGEDPSEPEPAAGEEPLEPAAGEEPLEPAAGEEPSEPEPAAGEEPLDPAAGEDPSEPEPAAGEEPPEPATGDEPPAAGAGVACAGTYGPCVIGNVMATMMYSQYMEKTQSRNRLTRSGGLGVTSAVYHRRCVSRWHVAGICVAWTSECRRHACAAFCNRVGDRDQSSWAGVGVHCRIRCNVYWRSTDLCSRHVLAKVADCGSHGLVRGDGSSGGCRSTFDECRCRVTLRVHSGSGSEHSGLC